MLVPRRLRDVRAKMLPERERCRAWATEPSMSTPTRACAGVSVKRLPWYLATTGRLSGSSTAARRRCSAAVASSPPTSTPPTEMPLAIWSSRPESYAYTPPAATSSRTMTAATMKKDRERTLSKGW